MTAATNTTLGEVKLAGDLLAGEASVPTLRPSGVKSGNYNVTDKIYVDAQGRITWAKQLPTSHDWPVASKTTHGIFQIGNNINLSSGTISVPKASASVAGVLKIGTGLNKNETTDATEVTVPTGSTLIFGGIRPDNVSTEADINGTFSINGQYLINAAGPASANNLGGVKLPPSGESGGFVISGGKLIPEYYNATTSTSGVIQPGNYFTVDTNGVLNATAATSSTTGLISNNNYAFHIDGTGQLGCHWANDGNYSFYGVLAGVSGPNIALDDATHTLSANYSFSDFSGDATTSTKGKVQVGDNIDVNSGVISMPLASGTSYGVFKVSGRSFKIVNSALTYDSNYPASALYYGHVKPDGTSIYFSDEANAVIAADFDAFNASTTAKGYIQPGTGLSISSGTISADTATASSKGIVQVGSGLIVNNGTLSVDMTEATKSSRGLVQVGSNIDVNAGVISVPDATYLEHGVVTSTNETNVKIVDGVMSFEIGNATPTQLGFVKPGLGTYISNGIINLSTPAATSTTLGTVKPHGVSTWIDESGSLHHRLASNSVKGVVGAGRGINIDSDGLMTIANATEDAPGIVQPGYGLSVDSGVLSVPAGYGLIKVNENNVFNHAQFFKPEIINANSETVNYNLAANIIEIEASTSFDQIEVIVNQMPALGITDFTNQSIFFVYKVVYKDGTSTPVQVKVSSAFGTDSAFMGAGCVLGDIIVYEFKIIRANSNYYQLNHKSATVFK